MKHVRIGILSLFALVLAVLCVSPVTAAGPEPDPVPKRWQLNLEVGPLRILSVNEGLAGPKAYFYLTYKVTNKTGQDVLFAPAFDLVAADGKIRLSGQGVSADVTKAVIEHLGNTLIQDQISILGSLPQGPENAREGVVIWPAESLKPGDISIFAGGFSGETTTVTPPVPVPDAKAKTDAAKDGSTTKDASTGADKEAATKKVVLRKTDMLRYRVAGDLSNHGDEPFTLIEQRWVMR